MSSSDLVFGNITVELRPLLYPKEVQNSCFLRRGEKMPSCFISIGSGFRQFFFIWIYTPFSLKTEFEILLLFSRCHI